MGGAGDVGSRAVEELAASEGVEKVTIADRDLPRSQEIAQSLQDAAAEVAVVQVDAMNHDDLVGAIQGHDVVASALGPFYLFEPRLVAATVAAGVDYCSVCDEWDATETVMNDFHDAAQEKGVRALLGLGTSPGVTNVGVRFLADQFDSLEKIDISVYQPLDAGGGEAVIRHMIHIMHGKTVAWRDGARFELKACRESRTVRFPRFGEIKVWNMGHAEPLTLPRYLDGLKEVNFFMGYGEGASFFVLPARLGLFGFRSLTNAFVRFLMWMEGRGPKKKPAEGAIRIDVSGTINGASQQRMACGLGQMREATGLSLAVGALMLGNQELRVKEGGVYPPEGCLEPRIFLERMAAKGITAFHDLEMTQPVV
jgi:saccharopine dehydrogenase-like NADP-dependent oxidoreductase